MASNVILGGHSFMKSAQKWTALKFTTIQSSITVKIQRIKNKYKALYVMEQKRFALWRCGGPEGQKNNPHPSLEPFGTVCKIALINIIKLTGNQQQITRFS